MSILVTVRIPDADPDRVRRVSAENPELGRELKELLDKHGNISHRRYFANGEILDIDEWEDEAGFQAFLAEAGPIIQKFVELRGTGQPRDTLWHPF